MHILYHEVMGRHGLGTMNENGERFADACALDNMVIGGSVFLHKRIHKQATWVSPDLITENQIDHICIAKKFSPIDTKSYRSCMRMRRVWTLIRNGRI